MQFALLHAYLFVLHVEADVHWQHSEGALTGNVSESWLGGRGSWVRVR